MKQKNYQRWSRPLLLTLLSIFMAFSGASSAWADAVTDDFSSYSATTSGTTLGDNWVIIPGTETATYAQFGQDYTFVNGTGDDAYVYGYSGNSSKNVWLVLKKQVTGTVSFRCSNSYSNAQSIYVTKVTQVGSTFAPTGAATQYSLDFSTSKYTKEFNVGEDPAYIAFCVDAYSSTQRSKIRLLSVTYTEYVDAGAIAKPTDFTTTATTSNSATFSWTAGGEETAWQIAYDTDTDFDKDRVTPAPTDITAAELVEGKYTLTGLSESTTYYAYLRAKSGEDVSSWTSKISFTTPAQYPAPTAFAMTDYEATTATFGWTNGSSETAWQIKQSTDENFNPDTEGNNQNVTEKPYTLTGLTAETTYYAYLRADYGSSHYSAWSDKITFKPSATKSVTVNNGSTTNSNIPVYGNWVDNVDYNKSQFVIPATSLTAVNGRNITKLTFYTNSGSAIAWTGNVFDIYMKETVATTVSTSLDRTGTKVFTGSLSVAADGKMEITLGENFPYEGENLQISFDMTTSGTYTSTSFYGVEGVSGSSMCTSNGTTGTSSNFLPQITISSIPGAVVAVKKPKSLEATSVLSTKATLSWTDGEDGLTAWQVALGTTSEFDPDGVTPIDANANPFTVTGLTAETTYYAYVRAKKGDDTSDWSNKVSFTTPNAKPSDVVVAASDNSAKFSWTANAGETAWQIKYSTESEFDPASEGTLQAVSTNPYTLTGLVPETTYYAYLRADLGGGEYSDWTSKQTFETGFEHELTVNNGDATTESAPFNGWNADGTAENGNSQFIIPASQLAGMNGGIIKKLTFYMNNSSATSWSSSTNPTFKVFLKEVDYTEFASATLSWEGLTEVYDGGISIANKQITVAFDSPFEYMGGNLLIGFKETAAGGYGRIYWYGVNTGTNTAINGSNVQFLPKTTFNYETLTGPRLEVSTDALDFGEINQSSTAEDKQKTFTISNTGVADLTSLSVAVSGAGYSVSALPRTNITTAGAESTPIELTVTLAPTVSGSYPGTVTISAAGQPNKVINLTATYVADPILGVFNDVDATDAATTGETINFGYVEEAPVYTYYIKNTGAGTLDVAVTNGGLAVSPANASLAAGEQQAFTITPNVANADATVTFTGTNHDGGAAIGTFTVTLQGTVMPLTTTFFEGFNYADGDASDTQLVGWEINNSTNNVAFADGTLKYTASIAESGNVITPRLRVAGTTDVLRFSASVAYKNAAQHVTISYSADKTNWTTAITKEGNSDFSDVAVNVLKNFAIDGIPEGSYYFKIELSDAAVGYFYGFSTSHPAAVALNESSTPSLEDNVVRDVTLTRNFIAGWNTICLPFAVAASDMESKFGAGVKLYDCTGFSENVLSFEQVNTGIVAGKPYLIYVANAIADPITFWNATISATAPVNTVLSGVTFHGTFAPIAAGGVLTGKYGISKVGRIAKANSATHMNGFRGYLEGELSSARISIFDETTGISRIYDANEVFGKDAKVYNLSGQKVENAKKGVYIVNGRKVVVK